MLLLVMVFITTIESQLGPKSTQKMKTLLTLLKYLDHLLPKLDPTSTMQLHEPRLLFYLPIMVFSYILKCTHKAWIQAYQK